MLTGEIDRHSVQRIRAVIWLCDLRGFSSVANRVGAGRVWSRSSTRYLEAMARPVLDNRGQILKFMGDGFLATFDLAERDSEAGVRRRAHGGGDAARLLSAFNAERRAAGKRTLDFGVGLHLGEVLYGNIGASERLDFTVVGSAVNEASRIEGMCRPLQRKLLVSSSFHDAAAGSGDRMTLARIPCAARHPRAAGALHASRAAGAAEQARGDAARCEHKPYSAPYFCVEIARDRARSTAARRSRARRSRAR